MAEQAGEGILFKVRGKCRESATAAFYQSAIPDLTMSDGEIRFDAKIVSGAARANIFFVFRSDGTSRAYSFVWIQAEQRPAFVKFTGSDSVDEFGDHVDLAHPDDWTNFAVRVQGPNMWFLIDNQTVMFKSDGDFDSGRVSFGIRRRGEDSDEQETAVVIRNLRVSALADSDPSRSPTYK